MRCAWLVVGLLLAGCGATPNGSATQTRTSEIVELTVSARLLPTANPAIPPTPVLVTPVPTTIAIASSVPMQPTPLGNRQVPDFSTYRPTSDDSGTLIAESWVAFSPALRVRFFAPPSLVEAAEFNNDQRYSLGSPSNVYDFEALDVYRFVGNRGGDFTRTWVAENGTLGKGANVYGMTTTSGPRTQQVGAFQGNVGQFNYVQADNQLRISGTMWVGQVGGDEVVIVYRCTPAREVQLDPEFAQILATIDFDAR